MVIAILIRYERDFLCGDGNFKKIYEEVYRLQKINMLKENTNAHSKGSTA